MERRRPNEVDGDINAKCSVPPVGDSRSAAYNCPTRCNMVNDPILAVSSTVEIERFCFYHCQPTMVTLPIKKLSNNFLPSVSLTGGNIQDTECIAISQA